MKNSVELIILCLFSLTLMGCGTKQLCANLSFVTINNEVTTDQKTIIENRSEEVCTFYVLGIPLNASASPQRVFNKISENAYYINNLSIYPSGFSLWEMDNGNYLFGKQCWNATGVVNLIDE